MPVRNGRTKGSLRGGGSNHRGGSSSAIGGGSNFKKITIKPFSKPPTLPPNFYESTSQELLKGTLQVLLTSPSNSSLSSNGMPQSTALYGESQPAAQTSGNAIGNSNNKSKISLQNSYTSVVNLVSHQYGPRLYKDLRDTMQQAAVQVLPESIVGAGAAKPGEKNGHGGMLSFIQAQYSLYVDYVLLCKHVFLPLDRTHLWQEDSQVVIKRTMSTSHTHHNQTLWEVGLCQFRNRLMALQLDHIVYKYWFQMLMNDWIGNSTANLGLSINIGGTAFTSGFDGNAISINSRQLLQQTYYMWSDLHMLPSILNQLQEDLQAFLNDTSEKYKATSPDYPSSQFIHFVYDKWIHMSYQWTFLPKSWLCTLLEVHLLKPHLHHDWILNPKHFYPILEQELQVSSSSIATSPKGPPSTPTRSMPMSMMAMSPTTATNTHNQLNQQASPMVKLWMLAGRLPDGYQLVAQCIGSYAKVRGLAIIQRTGGTGGTGGSATSGKLSTPSASSTNMIADLLDLQQQMYRLVHYKLPKGNDHIVLKQVWEEVINTTAITSNATNNISVAEALAKFVDQILKSTKKMDQYAIQTNANIYAPLAMTTTPQAIPSATKGTATPDAMDHNKATPNANTGASTPSAQHHNQNNDLLSRIISGIFVHLQAKDIFEAFYKRDLAKRLLWNRVVSMDVETHFCSLLKAECGAGYTSKMEGMFQDIHWSREAMSRYKQTNFIATNTPSQQQPTPQAAVVEMEAQVLTTGYWPVYPQYPNLILPQSLKLPQDRFTNYYKTKYQGRRMTWQYALGHCIVRANGFTSNPQNKKNKGHRGAGGGKIAASGAKKVYELVVSLCQALVLIQFQHDDSKFTLPQLMSAIGLDDRDEMERILQSLSLGKDGTRVLRKIDHNQATGDNVNSRKVRLNVHDADSFVINQSFDSNQRRIRVTNIMLKETKEEREKTVETVSRDRLYMIDASLVRIMKARKTIEHRQLIPEVLEQVKVPVQSSDIKKRIESLIEREYMERDQKDRQRYNYLA